MAKIEKPPALGAPMDANIMKRAFVIFVMRHHGHNEETATDLISLLYASREGLERYEREGSIPKQPQIKDLKWNGTNISE
jgi:hypothetical protein